MPHTVSPLSTVAIQQYAERVADAHEIFPGRDKPADLDALLRRLGGRTVFSDNFSGKEALTVRGIGDFDVHLPPMTSARRDRFTIAHELGHYFLHYRQPGLDGPEKFERGERNPLETQANYFAAALLMPSSRFRRTFRRLSPDMWAIADVFGVSPRAVEVRAQSLGLS